MPRKVIDYSKTVIYKIVPKDLNLNYVYVGSTTDFVKRKYQHKFSCKTLGDCHYNYKLYKTVRENGGWEEFDMIEIEKYPCNDRNECLCRERYWFEELQANMNKYNPIRNSEEYKIKDLEEFKQMKKEKNLRYRIKNDEILKKKKKICHVCELCQGKYQNTSKARHFKSKKHLDSVNNKND
jgi:hypothetical protein